MQNQGMPLRWTTYSVRLLPSSMVYILPLYGGCPPAR